MARGLALNTGNTPKNMCFGLLWALWLVDGFTKLVTDWVIGTDPGGTTSFSGRVLDVTQSPKKVHNFKPVGFCWFVAFCYFLVIASAFSCILFFVIVVVAYFYCVFAVFCKKIIILNACIRSVQRNSEWENILSNRRIHQRCVYFRLLLLILHSFYSVLIVLTLSTTDCMVRVLSNKRVHFKHWREIDATIQGHKNL